MATCRDSCTRFFSSGERCRAEKLHGKKSKEKPVFRREKASALCHQQMPCIPPFSELNGSLCKKVVYQIGLGNIDTEDNTVNCRRAVCKPLVATMPGVVSFQAIELAASLVQEPGVAACNESLLTASRPSASLFGPREKRMTHVGFPAKFGIPFP